MLCNFESKGTSCQISVSGPYLFLNMFLNDLDISQDDFISLCKYADDLTICAAVLQGKDWSLDLVGTRSKEWWKLRVSC